MASDVKVTRASYIDNPGNAEARAPEMFPYDFGRGVVDYGKLFQFAPYESGYCFLSVLSSPTIWASDGKDVYNRGGEYQRTFVRILETEFKGLSGIDDITTETTDAVATPLLNVPYVIKTNALNTGQFSMSFTEKTGSAITKYISMYLKSIRAPYTNVKSYNKSLTIEEAYKGTIGKETFDLLYIITNNTCLVVERAFLITNAQPTSAPYSEIYNVTKGDIGIKEVTVPWVGCIREGAIANALAKFYLENLIKTVANDSGIISLDGYNYEYSLSANDKTYSIEDALATSNNAYNAEPAHDHIYKWVGVDASSYSKADFD